MRGRSTPPPLHGRGGEGKGIASTLSRQYGQGEPGAQQIPNSLPPLPPAHIFSKSGTSAVNLPLRSTGQGSSSPLTTMPWARHTR